LFHAALLAVSLQGKDVEFVDVVLRFLPWPVGSVFVLSCVLLIALGVATRNRSIGVPLGVLGAVGWVLFGSLAVAGLATT
jgi:hypothetical protein